MATSVDLPDKLKEEVNQLIQEGYYSSKSELIRDAIRKLLEEKTEGE